MRSPGSEDWAPCTYGTTTQCANIVLWIQVWPVLVLLHSPTPPNFTRTQLRVLNIPSLVEEDARIAAGLRGGITGRWTPTYTPE